MNRKIPIVLLVLGVAFFLLRLGADSFFQGHICFPPPGQYSLCDTTLYVFGAWVPAETVWNVLDILSAVTLSAGLITVLYDFYVRSNTPSK